MSRVIMVQPNLTGYCLSASGSDIRSLSWTKCVCHSRDNLSSSRLASSHVKWLQLVVSAEDAESTPRASKGFGNPKKAVQPGVKKGGLSRGNKQHKGVLLNNADRTVDREGSSQLSKVIDIVDKKVSGQKVSPLRIDPNEAKKGRVDFVRVQTWGEDEESGKLENLKVKSFSPAATSSSKTSGPFYEKLVNRLQLLESKGEMAVAHVKLLPSFDRWVFGEDRYVQFLVDQLYKRFSRLESKPKAAALLSNSFWGQPDIVACIDDRVKSFLAEAWKRAVFQALTDVIETIKKERCGSVHDLEDDLPLGGAATAVSLFAEDLGLDRCKALNADITSFAESLKARGLSVESFPATTQSASYAKYLRQLGLTGLENSEKAKDACLKFLAHVFSIYVSHLTTGMRIGAKAMDNVGVLRQTNAVNFYRDYPLEGKDPLKLFIQTVNSAGLCILSEEDHEQVMEELPKAMQRTSLILSVLAVEEQVFVAGE